MKAKARSRLVAEKRARHLRKLGYAVRVYKNKLSDSYTILFYLKEMK